MEREREQTDEPAEPTPTAEPSEPAATEQGTTDETVKDEGEATS